MTVSTFRDQAREVLESVMDTEEVLDRLEALLPADRLTPAEILADQRGEYLARIRGELVHAHARADRLNARVEAVEALCDNVDAQEWLGPSRVVEVSRVRAAMRGGS